jgi:hypothetical protein
MTAMTKARGVVRRESINSRLPVKGATTILQGALTVMDGGLACPGRTATGLIAVGIAVTTAANPGADGAATVDVERGTFKFFNHGADAVTAADIQKDCFIVDDQTVAKTAATNTRSIAGTVIDVEGDGVWVRVGQ